MEESFKNITMNSSIRIHIGNFTTKAVDYILCTVMTTKNFCSSSKKKKCFCMLHVCTYVDCIYHICACLRPFLRIVCIYTYKYFIYSETEGDGVNVYFYVCLHACPNKTYQFIQLAFVKIHGEM